MIHVVGLLARAGHGKTTVANYLRDHYGAEIVSFASPLKKIAKVAMDFSDSQLYGTQAEKEAIDPRYGFSCRTFLQRLGTEGIRAHLGELAFCEALALRISADSAPRVCVVDDLRFPNEAAFVNRLDRRKRRRDADGKMPSAMTGAVVKILCTDASVMAEGAGHASEAGIDAVVPNDLRGVVTSSRALGTAHLICAVEELIQGPGFVGLRDALLNSRDRLRT